MKFYLGTHMVHWLWTVDVPLFMSQRRLIRNKKLYPAINSWALDSGGFSELSLYGEWRTTPKYYVDSIRRYEEHIGKLDWAACQDWMCEPFITAKTKKTVKEHQTLTTDSFIHLNNIGLETPIIPIIQGYTLEEYKDHIDHYLSRNIDLTKYPTVGIGSVCRRQGTQEILDILKQIDLNLHGFGVKKQGLPQAKQYLTSADSLAWSFNARYNPPLEGCTHSTCASCLKYALNWRNDILQIIR